MDRDEEYADVKFPLEHGLSEIEMEQIAETVEKNEYENIVRSYLRDYSDKELTVDQIRYAAIDYRNRVKSYVYEDDIWKKLMEQSIEWAIED